MRSPFGFSSILETFYISLSLELEHKPQRLPWAGTPNKLRWKLQQIPMRDHCEQCKNKWLRNLGLWDGKLVRMNWELHFHFLWDGEKVPSFWMRIALSYFFRSHTSSVEAVALGTLCEEELRFVKIFFENIEMSEDIFLQYWDGRGYFSYLTSSHSQSQGVCELADNNNDNNNRETNKSSGVARAGPGSSN